MSLIEDDEAFIFGVSSYFFECVFDLDISLIERLWFKEIDKIYFSKQRYTVILSNEDKYILRKSKNCYDKLKVLSYKKGIRIKELSDFIF